MLGKGREMVGCCVILGCVGVGGSHCYREDATSATTAALLTGGSDFSQPSTAPVALKVS